MEGESKVQKRAYEYIDATADVQKEVSDIVVTAGVSELKVLFSDGKLSMPVVLTVGTSTGLHRGVHMSRLVRAAARRQGASIEEWARAICGEVNKTQPGSEVSCRFEVAFGDQFGEVEVMAKERGRLTYKFKVRGMTACPCSKKMIGVGHMQRAEITLVLKSAKVLDSRDVMERMMDCFSAPPKEEMKRLEEAKRILAAQANPKFAEDLVRDCVRKFPGATSVIARCYESIHAHDAMAWWPAKPGSALPPLASDHHSA